MRRRLSHLKNQRLKFQGTFKRLGKCPSGKTILLVNILLNDKQVTDHAWLMFGKRFARLKNYSEGDKITFYARITKYTKRNGKQDYRFSYPTKIQRINN